MCDTMVALGNATADGSVVFAKSSDRDPNEAHELVHIPRATHPEGSSVQCTYIQIPQVTETFEVLLARPFWIWGAEMGANEHGVVIGNEAVFTRLPYEKGPGLIGMDFVRLALERAATARAALDVITHLLATYGQGGNCGFAHKLYYHNSFLIADPNEAWVLETAGRQWAAQRVRDVRSISNAITIGREWDLASDGLVDYAIERGWCKSHDDFHFGRCYSDFLYTHFSAANPRQCRTTDLMTASRGGITVETMMAILRDHGPEAAPDPRKGATPWAPGRGLTGADICMHASFGPVRVSQSVGSLVSHLTPELQTHWLTGTSAPCTGIFKPVWLGAGLPDLGPSPIGHYQQAALWWRHESLHRAVLRDYATRMTLYREERDALEASFISAADDCRDSPPAERAAFSARCFAEADEATTRWTARVRAAPIKKRPPLLHAIAWRTFNRQAHFIPEVNSLTQL